jgi:hypothetical protein
VEQRNNLVINDESRSINLSVVCENFGQKIPLSLGLSAALIFLSKTRLKDWSRSGPAGSKPPHDIRNLHILNRNWRHIPAGK